MMEEKSDQRKNQRKKRLRVRSLSFSLRVSRGGEKDEKKASAVFFF